MDADHRLPTEVAPLVTPGHARGHAPPPDVSINDKNKIFFGFCVVIDCNFLNDLGLTNRSR